jgi:hypothetical protein
MFPTSQSPRNAALGSLRRTLVSTVLASLRPGFCACSDFDLSYSDHLELRPLRKGSNHLHLWLAVLTTSKYRKVNAFIVLYRSALTGCLYAKTLRLTSMAAREVGQVRIRYLRARNHADSR